MKSLRVSATVIGVAVIISLLALLFIYLSLIDIAHGKSDISLEWRIVGICHSIFFLFTISTFTAPGFLLNEWRFRDMN